MKIHPVFHVSLVEPAHTDPLPGQVQPPPPPIIIDDEPEWEVEEILYSRFVGRTLQYLARWVGYDQPTWEPANLFANSPSAVKEFHTALPSQAPTSHFAKMSELGSRLNPIIIPDDDTDPHLNSQELILEEGGLLS